MHTETQRDFLRPTEKEIEREQGMGELERYTNSCLSRSRKIMVTAL